MKRLIYFITLTLVLVSCGSRSGYFSFEGRLLNLNQGEFYVYSPDGVFNGVDTIKVDGGRFTFETPCKQEGTIMIVFPNFSEQPVFAEPGKTVTIKGDALHLKELEIEGTDVNEQMTAFSQRIAKVSPPEVLECAEQFVKDNPQSAVSVYILRKYFVLPKIEENSKDLKKAEELVNVVAKAQPKNGNVARMVRYLKVAGSGVTGSRMPSFTATDVYGKSVSDGNLRGKVAVVYSLANWSYESRNMHGRLTRLKKEYGDKLALLGISLDASRQSCKNMLRIDSVSAMVVCDQMMFQSPFVELFAIDGVPANILFNAQGHIVERNVELNEIESKLKVLLN